LVADLCEGDISILYEFSYYYCYYFITQLNGIMIRFVQENTEE